MKTFLTSLTAIMLGIVLGASSLLACPSKEALQESIKKVFKRNLDVVEVKPGPVEGLCQVQVKLQGQNRIVYSDDAGKFLIAGQVFAVDNSSNLTRQALAEMNRLTKEELKKLESLTAFKIGSGDKVVYFVTDPMCPYCKKAEEILEPLAKMGKVEVRFLLFPLKFHKGAKEQSISIICDNKGLEGLKQQYKSDNQCEEGKQKVENTIKLLESKGIRGTPTYIFEDGLYRSGVMQEKALKEKLGIE